MNFQKVSIKAATCEELLKEMKNKGLGGVKGRAGATAYSIHFKAKYKFAANKPPGKTSMTDIKPKFEARFTLSRYEWTRPNDLPAKCTAAIDDWERRVEEHEEHHVAEIKDFVAKHNKGWSGKTLIVDGINKSKAETQLKALLQQKLIAEATAMTTELNNADPEWHKKTIDLDCKSCP
jgi:hypothetical protein